MNFKASRSSSIIITMLQQAAAQQQWHAVLNGSNSV
jgi:hypothetical protein